MIEGTGSDYYFLQFVFLIMWGGVPNECLHKKCCASQYILHYLFSMLLYWGGYWCQLFYLSRSWIFKVEPEEIFYVACAFGFRLYWVRTTKACLTLRCGNNSSFSLFKMFPVVFLCSESIIWDQKLSQRSVFASIPKQSAWNMLTCTNKMLAFSWYCWSTCPSHDTFFALWKNLDTLSLDQGYSTTFNKGPVTNVQACRGLITLEKNFNNKQTQVMRTKHEVIYCSTSQLVGEIAFLVSYQFLKFWF